MPKARASRETKTARHYCYQLASHPAIFHFAMGAGRGRIGRMKACISTLSLCLLLCPAAGLAQSSSLSITIGTHVLKLGMSESSVIEELGSDLEVKHLGTGKVSSWLVERKVGAVYKLVGNVVFDTHGLTSAIRYWEPDESSSKSLFYAINEAMQSLERDGLTKCQISTSTSGRTEESPSGTGSGSMDTKKVEIDCGRKLIAITLTLSDVPDVVPTEIGVMEELKSE